MNPSYSALDQNDTEAGLRDLGLGQGDVVEVHSSLSSLGFIVGGAKSVIAALVNVVGETGAIVMSAYPVSPAVSLTDEEIARGITWKVRILSEDSGERTGMGAISDAFRTWPGVQCGTGLHRVCAWGWNAALHCQRGYAYLLEMDGWALLIGVGIDRCSSMHQAEKVGFPNEIVRCFQVPEEILIDYPADTWSVGYGSTPEDGWAKVWDEANRQGLVRQGRMGQADCKLFKARAMAGIYENWLRIDPYGLFGVQRDE